MTPFPVIDSTLSAKHIGNYLKEAYAVVPDVTCKLFRTGINHSYIVTAADEKWVFRIYSFNWRTEEEIAAEIQLLELLHDHHISISFPIKDSRGRYIQKIDAPEGPRFGVLFSYARGGKVRNFSEQTSHSIGTLMAKIHAVTENLQLARISYNAETLTKLPYQYAKAHFSESLEDMHFIRHAGSTIAQVFSRADQGNIRKGVVHLDIWYDNMHINSESDMTIFDFDFCGNGWLLHDIAYFIMQLFHVEADKDAFKRKQDAFFAGYETITKISAEEKRLLPYSGLSIWIFYLGIQSQRFDNWSNVFLSENYLKRYIGMVKDWMRFNEVELVLSINS